MAEVRYRTDGWLMGNGGIGQHLHSDRANRGMLRKEIQIVF